MAFLGEFDRLVAVGREFWEGIDEFVQDERAEELDQDPTRFGAMEQGRPVGLVLCAAGVTIVILLSQRRPGHWFRRPVCS
ncbi:hypothetical protein GCM10017744_088900 [Streptomyces antimycoticus]|uniref:Uncharacterized protein n=1 Tax=Streptomyces antimycoticus TaxID=68175 RepID=A0A4D4JXQ5_9ACTN|nr:hypothetical protein [Streptomyces antimycoticus]GDY39198.1 hypothetical protein SANT12839_000800 [Streptomyces antimycoticus]